MITVKKYQKGCSGIYIGRTFKKYGFYLEGSPLANPFPLNHEDERDNVLAQYRNWLYEKMNSDSPQLAELYRLKKLYDQGQDLVLLCWCAPKPCHGDVIKEILEQG